MLANFELYSMSVRVGFCVSVLLVASSCACCTTACGVEFTGEVAEVRGTEVLIRLAPDAELRLGDAVSVVVEVPDVGEAVVGGGTVIGMRGALVVVEIKQSTGRIAAGQKIRAQTTAAAAKPTTPARGPSQPTAEPAAPAQAPIPQQATVDFFWIAVPEGRLLWGVLPDGAAYQAGLRNGDIVTRLDGAAAPTLTRNAGRLIVLRDHRPGDQVVVEYLRDGRPATATVTLATYPADNGLERVTVAAEEGELWAVHGVGVLHYMSALSKKGTEAEREFATALPWFYKGSEADFAWSHLFLGNLYATGRGLKQSDEQAVEYYEKARHAGKDQLNRLAVLEATVQLGLRALRASPPDDVRAVAYFHEAADAGSIDAQNHLGWMYEQNRGISGSGLTPQQALTKAAEWYRRAAEQAHADAQCNLANLYTLGRGVPQDYALALEWTQKAAAQGLARAEFKMGAIASEGQGVQPSDATAFGWFESAAEKGFADAQAALARCYEQGRGTTRNRDEAIRWYRMAAAQNHPEAIKGLRQLGIQP